MLISLGCYIVGAYLNYQLVENPGAFVHQWDVLLKDMSDILFPLFLSGSFYIGAVLTIKAAILLDWIRILIPYGVRNNFFWLCYGVLGANVIFYIVTLFLMNFACVPIEKNWNPLFVGGSCPVNRKALNITSAVLNLCSDISILLLPQHVIWRLDMSTKRRVGVSVIFAIGVLYVRIVISSTLLYFHLYFYFIFLNVKLGLPFQLSFFLARLNLVADKTLIFRNIIAAVLQQGYAFV